MPGGASDKTQCYEQLRTRVIEMPRAPIAAASAEVLVRQGMCVWMQLEASQDFQLQARGGDVQPRTILPGTKHSELLAVLTSLVFNVCKQKESA